MTEDQKRAAGLLFWPNDPVLKAQKLRAHKLSAAYNLSQETDVQTRNHILSELLASIGAGSVLFGPIYFHYGIHTQIGSHFFGNFNLTIQDDAQVVIGNHCDFGPNVTIVTPVHPLIAKERIAMADPEGNPRRLCYAKPVHIGNGCWLGAGVIVYPGVTIGDNCVISAGSVVTSDIPHDSLAGGNPCTVRRTITEADSMRTRPNRCGTYRVY